MTFINYIFNQMTESNLVSSTEDFSERYLKRSPSYYRTLKAQQRDANTEVLVNLVSQLASNIEVHKNISAPANDISKQFLNEWIERCAEIEQAVADELAKRATRQGTMSKGGLDSFLSALQRIKAQISNQTTTIH